MFFFSSRRLNTIFALVTGVQTCALPIWTILHVLYAEPDKSLRGVADFLSDPARPFERALGAMLRTPHLGDRPHPVVASAAREMLNRSDNERSGVLSTAMSYLGLYHDPRSEERRVGKACVRTGRSRWTPDH